MRSSSGPRCGPGSAHASGVQRQRRGRDGRGSRRGRGSSPRRAGSAPGTRPGARRARSRCGRSRAARAAPRARRAGTPAARRGTARRGARARSRPAAAASRRRPAPPPTRVWCGARRRARPSARARSAPATLSIAADSSASSSLSGGRMPGKRCASIDLPVPGGPTISTLWPPGGGDLERALGGRSGPCTSRRSGSAARRARGSGARLVQRRARRRASPGSRARDHLEQVRRRRGSRGRRPAPPRRRSPAAGRARAASPPARAQRERHRERAAHRAQLAGERELAGELVARRARAASIWPAAARMPSAIGRSKRPDSFGRSAGARLTVMRLLAGTRARWSAARRARARAPPDLGVGQADDGEARQAVGEVHFDGDLGRIDAARARLGRGRAHPVDSAEVRCRPPRPKVGTRPPSRLRVGANAPRLRLRALRAGACHAPRAHLARDVRNEDDLNKSSGNFHEEAFTDPLVRS